MHEIITYPLANDNKIFLSVTKPGVTISACTLQGSHVEKHNGTNEDAFCLCLSEDKIIAAVFDGCSSVHKIDDAKLISNARFASHFLKRKLELLIDKSRFADLLPTLNKLLLEEAKKHIHGRSPSVLELPTSTATIIELDMKRKRLQISHLGDSFCILYYRDNASKLISFDRNQYHERKLAAKIHLLATQAGITPRRFIENGFAKKLFEERVLKTHNRPDGTGQGILNGDPAAEQYIQQDQFSLTDVSTILIATDGLIPVNLNRHTALGRKKILSTLKNGDLKEIIRKKQLSEDADPTWQYVRTKHSDDATGIYIELGI